MQNTVHLATLAVNKIQEKNSTGQLLQNIFKAHWKEPFLFDGINNRTISYKDFFGSVLSYAKKLQEIGLDKNDTICILMPNSLDMIILYFSSLIMQITIVPIDPNKGRNDITEILESVNHKILISDEPKFENFSEKLLNISHFHSEDEKNSVEVKDLEVFSKIDYDKLFLITFTSGSTGTPKGVMHSFSSLIKSALALNKRFNFNDHNIFYHNLPMSYMAGILNLIILPFISSSKIVIGERFGINNVARFWDLPSIFSANTFWFIPTILELLIKLDRGTKGSDYSRKNNIIGCVGTAPLNNQTKIAFQNKYNIQLYESYGLSETLFVSTNFPYMDKENKVGPLLDDVEISHNKDGEILIRTPWMFLGYTNQEKENFIQNGMYLSGDLGEIDDDGFLGITGRKKDLIIKGGININPKKIEDFIRQYKIFNEYTILGFDDRYLGEKIVCFFVPNKTNHSIEPQKRINPEIIAKMGREYTIDEFLEVNEIPKTTQGKINKPKLRELYKLKFNVSRN